MTFLQGYMNFSLAKQPLPASIPNGHPYLSEKKASQFIIISQEKNIAQKMNYSFEIQPFSTTNVEITPTDPSLVICKQKALLKVKKAPKKSKVKISSFSWSKTQQRKYIKFLKGNMKLFELSPKERKQIKINVLMSYAIKTRTAAQCHSHHQKMMLRYNSIQNIIESLNHLFEKQAKIYTKEQVQSNTEVIEARETQEELFFEQSIKEEPFWYQYLDLMDDNRDQEEDMWNNEFFFSE